jgi:hypothetical protein
VAIDPFELEAFGLVVAGAGGAIANPEQRLGGVHRDLRGRSGRWGIAAEGLAPAIEQAGACQGHGGAGEDQHVVAAGQQGQVAHGQAAELEEVELVAGQAQGAAVGPGFAAVAVLAKAGEVQLDHQGDAAQHRPAQAQQQPVAAGGDALDVEAVVLAGNGQERPQQRFAGQGGGEGILAVGGVAAEPLAAAGEAAAIEVKAAEHLAVGAALGVEGQRFALVAVVPAAAQAVGAHQPEPIAVEGQALQIGFTLGFAASQAEVGQLDPAGVAVAAAGIGLQALEAAALIARQPQPAITSRQAGEVVAQIGGSAVVGVAEVQPALEAGDGEGDRRHGDSPFLIHAAATAGICHAGGCCSRPGSNLRGDHPTLRRRGAR